MDSKETYEAVAAVAAALPEREREVFADLLDRLTATQRPRLRMFLAARRWLRDAGWV